MKITFTITLDVDEKGITVSQEDNKNVINIPETSSKNVTELPEVDMENVTIPDKIERLGEKLPKGRWATKPRPRTEEYPFNAGDIKKEMSKYNITFTELARELGNYPVQKLRNIFRYDNRRFTMTDYNVILKAIDLINKSREII